MKKILKMILKFFIENYTKLNKDQKSSDVIVSDLVKVVLERL